MKKKYITKQEDIKDCGAACLSSIIKYYNGYVPMEKIRQDTKTNKDGTTFFNLVNTLNKYGFEAKGIKTQEKILKDDLVLPAIAHVILKNGLHHFIVLYKIDKVKQNVLIMDPAKGFVTLKISDFLDIWTNVLIVMIPKFNIPKYKKQQTTATLFLKLFLEEKKLVVQIVLMTIILTIFSILSSFYIKVALNTSYSFKYLIILFSGISLFKVISLFLRNRYENYLNRNIDQKVYIPFLKHLFTLPLSYVKTKSTGEILTRVKELDNIKNLFSKVFVTIFLDLILAGLTSIFLYQINSTLFWVLWVILGIYLLISFIFSPKIKTNLEDLIDNEASFNSTLGENIEGLETIKNDSRIKKFLEKINTNFQDYLNVKFKFNKLLNKQFLFKNLIEEVGLLIINTIGIYLTMQNEFSLLNLITFNTLLLYIFEPFKRTIDLIPEINFIKASQTKINEFLVIPEEDLTDYKEKFLNGKIEIKNLSYSYNDYLYILENLNLEIFEKEKIMLKGPSGSGKSTLCKLLYQLYDLNKGEILINNKNIKDYKKRTIRKNITYLSQKENLWTETIKNNILLERKIDEQKYQDILNICQIDDVVKNKIFADGTLITNNGFNLSGGERQRIILGRALLKNSSIIILDEALSEVEEKMEQQIIKNILSYFKDKTIIYVTHRDHDKLFDRVINLEGRKDHETIKC